MALVPWRGGRWMRHENARSAAATEEEEENDNNDESFGWGPEGFVRSAAARRAWDATISSVAKRADRTSEHSSPAPPSDRQLADQLREKIAALRAAERRGDAMIAAVRAAERHGDESDSEGRDTPSSSVPAVTDDTGSGSGSIDTIPGADDWLRSSEGRAVIAICASVVRRGSRRRVLGGWEPSGRGARTRGASFTRPNPSGTV